MLLKFVLMLNLATRLQLLGKATIGKMFLAQMGRGGGANPCTVTKSYSMFGLVQCYDNNVVLKVFYGAVASSPIPESLPDPGHWTLDLKMFHGPVGGR